MDRPGEIGVDRSDTMKRETKGRKRSERASGSASASASPRGNALPLRVLIVDDHRLARHGLRLVLQEAFPTAGFWEAGSCAEARRLLKAGRWNLAVLEIVLPDGSGLEVVKELRKAGNLPPVLAMSLHSKDHYALRAMKAGAAGYLGKDAPPATFMAAATRVLSGHDYIGATLAERLAEEYRGRKRKKTLVERLSNRELQVLQMIGAGRTVTEISRQLGLSVKTVSTYRLRLLEKLGMKNNAEAMRFAVSEGLVA